MEMEDNIQELQILLFTLPCTHNKEYVAIIKEYNLMTSMESLIVLFDKILNISKYTNTEMYHFLSVFSKFIDCVGSTPLASLSTRVRSLKFFPGEKDTDLVIYKYFEVINKLSPVMEYEALHDVYSRYIFLQSRDIVNNVMIQFIYSKFKEFLREHPLFLKYTIEKGVYKELILKNEFLIDFYSEFSRVVLIDSSLDLNLGMRIFIMNSTKNKYLLQEFFSDIPSWYMKSLAPNLLPFLFYNFDVFGIYRELALEYSNTMDLDTFIDHIEGDLGCVSLENDIKSVSVRFVSEQTNSQDCSCFHANEDIRNLRMNLKESILAFNKTLDMDLLTHKFGQIESMMLLRISKMTNLKSLGEFLCKSKNQAHLKIFTSIFDFHDLTLIEALRVYLGSFFLVGESQVIHRVLTTFSEKYFIDNVGKCTFMELIDDEKTRKFLFNFSFSLLVLNTKMYNPNIKAKPTFSSHMADFSSEEIPEGFSLEYLQSQFESVCENKMELAVRNRAGRYHFAVYESICKAYGIQDTFQPIRKECYTCIVRCYRELFSKVASNFLDGPPEKFYLICELLKEKKYIERYLRENRSDTGRFLCMFKYYTTLEGDLEFYKLFLTTLKRIEKPRHGVFSEIKNSLIKGNSQGEDRDNILSQYKRVFNDLLDCKFKNINLLGEALKGTTSGFVFSLVTEIFGRNLGALEDLSMLPDEKISEILDKTIASGNRHKFSELSKFMSPESLLVYYKNMLETVPRFINIEICESFKRIEIYNEDAFSILLNLQKEFDLFDYAISLHEEKIECRGVNDLLEERAYLFEKEVFTFEMGEEYRDMVLFKVDSSKDILSCYSFSEKFKVILASPTNLFHFYASSKSILNQSKAKTIHKTGCPLDQELFSPLEMDCRLIYMLKKADTLNNKDVTNYTLWVVNLISSSLPVFCRFFVDNFGLLLTIKNSNLVNPIIKIFCSRLGKSLSGSPLCCKCGYSKLGLVESFVKFLIKYDLASIKDFDFYFKVRNEKINGREIRIEEDGLHWDIK